MKSLKFLLRQLKVCKIKDACVAISPFIVAFLVDIESDRLEFCMMSIGKVVRHISPPNTQRLDLGISGVFCRNLFGPVDHDQLRTELETELRRIAEEKRRRWNYDFEKEEPLNGSFNWERIGENRTVAFTTEVHFDSSVPDTRSCDISRLSGSSTTSNDAKNERSASKTSCFKTPERLPVKHLRKSPRITDYLRSRKKSPATRQINFTGKAGDAKECRKVQTRMTHCGNRRRTKQATLDAFTLKLRPRQANGKVAVSS